MIYIAHIKLKNSFNHYQQHDSHVDKWLDTKIVVIRANHPDINVMYMATVGDFDLDCKVGHGSTPEEAVENLKIAMEGG